MSNKTLQQKARKSNLMRIIIKYGAEKFTFNLYEELQISEDQINRELQEQPTAYGFLGLLQKRLKRVAMDLEVRKESVYGKLYAIYKRKDNPDTNRPYSDDLAKQLATAHRKYERVKLEWNQAIENAEIVGVCVKAFEQRALLIQSISANKRKEN